MSVLDWLPWVRDRRSDDLGEEMRAHLEMAAADRVARGEAPADAMAHARREFGNVGLVQELSRDRWGRVGLWIERGVQDTRFALRTLRRSPGFTAVAVLTIALGIAATTAVASLVYATLLRPLPYPHAEQLVRIEDDLAGIGARDVGMSTPEWRDLQRSGVFQYSSPTWFDNNNFTGSGSGHPDRVSILIVAPNYFRLLGASPQLGETFDPADATPGFNEQIVISDGLWKRAFGGDPRVLGRIVQLDSDSYRIIGVMPPGFQSPEATTAKQHTEVWVAMGFAGAPITLWAQRSQHFPGVVARLADGLSIAEAQRRIDVLVRSLARQYPADYPPQSEWHIRLVPLGEYVAGDVRQPLLFLLAGVGLVLVIGCTNVASLLLTRATARSREMAVRQALGGAAARLTRQLLTESVVLSLIGALVAVVLLLATRGRLAQLVPASVPRLNDVAIHWHALAASLGAAVAAGALFGLAPALFVRGLDVTRVLKQEGRGSTGSGAQTRTRRALVVTELALSLVLMIAASLLLRSFWDLVHAPLGFDPRNVTIVRTRLPYPNDSTEDLYGSVADEARFVREVVRRAATIPGVEEAAVGSGAAIPLDHPEEDQTVSRVLFENRPSQNGQPALVSGSQVTPEYFGLLGMTLQRGRLLDARDDEHAPGAAVINEAMARTYWPDGDALGRRVRLSTRLPGWTTIVGIVADARTESLASPDVPQLYTSLYQRQGKHLAIFVRGHAAPGAIERQVRAHVQTLNSALPVFGAETLSDAVAASLAVRRFAMVCLVLFALTALLLSGLGIYGVIAFMVSERTHEIGVRLALGAQHEDVLRLVLRQGLRLVLVGGAIGVAGALLVSRAMAGLLYGVSPADPLSFAGVVALLTGVALAASYVPARRAIRVDPMDAMRY